MRRLIPTLLLALVVSLLLPTAATAAISPTPVGGAKWRVKTIRVYDGTPFLYREGVTLAMRAWNESRVGVALVRTRYRRTAHIVIGTKLFPGGVAGTGTLGAWHPSVILLDTNLVATEPIVRNGVILDFPGGAIPEEIASVAAHEFGHVLGLRHTTGCSLMVSIGDARCGYAAPPTGQWTCRMIQRRDLLAMKRRYGGTGVLRRSVYCPLSATRSGRVGKIATGVATSSRAYRLDWRNTTNTYGYVVGRSAAGGACPTTPGAAAHSETFDRSEFNEQWTDDGITAGTYCVVVWSKNGRGTLSIPRSVLVTVPSQSTTITKDPPVTNLTSSVAGDDVSFSWSQGAGTTMIRIYQYANDGTCRVPASTPVVKVEGGVQTTALLNDVWSGSWTFAVTRSTAAGDDSESDVEPATASAPVCTSQAIA